MITVRECFPDRERLVDTLARFSNIRIAVAGDFFLDRYLVLDRRLAETSLETGLTAQQAVAIRNSPGAAGTVVNNLAALGAGVITTIGIIGDDAYGFELRRALAACGANTDRLVVAPDRFTPTYIKPLVREGARERELERIDVINRTPTHTHLQQRVLDHMRSVLPEIDALVVLDQVSRRNCGVITDMIRDALALLAQEFPNVLVYADSRAHIGSFRGVVIKANSREAILAAGLVHTTHADDAQVWAAADELQRRTDRPVFITMGERGMLVATRERKVLVSGVPVSGPIDVTGAGDSATAGIVLSLAAGADLTQAAAVGNLVASITIEQLGTTGTASREQVLARFDASRIGQETP